MGPSADISHGNEPGLDLPVLLTGPLTPGDGKGVDIATDGTIYGDWLAHGSQGARGYHLDSAWIAILVRRRDDHFGVVFPLVHVKAVDFACYADLIDVLLRGDLG